MQTFKEYLNEETNLSKQDLHTHGIKKMSAAYIRHGVTRHNYDDKVTYSPRKKAALDKIEHGIQKQIDAHPDVSKERDRHGDKESENMMHDIRHKALTKSTMYHMTEETNAQP